MSAIEPQVKGLILRYAPSSWQLEDLHADTALGGEGIGLDSVKLVELLCVCEEQFGVHLPLELAGGEVLTISGLVQRIADAGARPGPGDAHGDSG